MHLFPDPLTSNSRRPYLYADCEGLEGGTGDPIVTIKESRLRKKFDRIGYKSQRFQELKIKWAKGDQACRGWMVNHLYPRVLFTFSDVVCYVTRNFRYASLRSSVFILSY